MVSSWTRSPGVGRAYRFGLRGRLGALTRSRPRRFKTFQIVAVEKVRPSTLSNSDWMPFGPRLRSFLSLMIEVTSSGPMTLAGEWWGRRLRELRPASPSSWKRRHHFRRVGREIPHRRQTKPASPVSANSVTHRSRARCRSLSAFIRSTYPIETIYAIATRSPFLTGLNPFIATLSPPTTHTFFVHHGRHDQVVHAGFQTTSHTCPSGS